MIAPADARNRRFVAEVLPYRGAAYNLARWICRSEVDASDIVQEALTRALRYFGSFRGEDARSWLLSIVRNSAHTWLATQKRPPALDAVEMWQHIENNPASSHQDPENPLHEVIHQQEANRVRRAIAELQVDYREVLILRELEDLSYRDIARIVDCPVGTVMSRLSRARDALSARLQLEAQHP